jgi:fructose-specific phosphotransferase system component IIB
MRHAVKMYREVFSFVDRCTAGCEAHTYFADESVCLFADSFRNEVVNNSQVTVGVENLSLYM